MADTEIVPVSELREVTVIAEGGEMPEKLREALSEVEKTTRQLAPLKVRAEREVKTADDYREIGSVLSETRGLKKQGVGYLSPFEALVERAKSFLKIKRQAHEVACGEIENVCLFKMKAYEREEVAATLREQERLNAERRKQAEEAAEAERQRKAKEIAAAQRAGEIGKREAEKQRQQAAAEAEKAVENVGEVKVKPNISSTPGYRRSTTYRIEVPDTAAAVKAFLLAVKAGRKDLLKYVILDEQALSAEARRIKDVEKFQNLYPEVRCIKE